MKDKKQEILKLLKKYKRMSISKVSIMVGLPVPYGTKYLTELETEGIVKKIVETHSTYWEINNGN